MTHESVVRVNPSLCKVPTPLDPGSAHPSSIHRAWPQGLVNRVSRLSEPSCMSMNLCKLFRVYKEAGSHQSTLEQLVPNSNNKKPEPRIGNHDDLRKIPFVCRYHAIFPKALNRALKQAPLPPYCSSRIMPAWRNALPTPLTMVARANGNTCAKMYQQHHHRELRGSHGMGGGNVAAVVPTGVKHQNLAIDGLKPYKLLHYVVE